MPYGDLGSGGLGGRTLSMPKRNFGSEGFGGGGLSMPYGDLGSRGLGRRTLSMPKRNLGSEGFGGCGLSIPYGDLGSGGLGRRTLSMPKRDFGSGSCECALAMLKSEIGPGDDSIVASEGGTEPMCISESSLGGSMAVPS